MHKQPESQGLTKKLQNCQGDKTTTERELFMMNFPHTIKQSVIFCCSEVFWDDCVELFEGRGLNFGWTDDWMFSVWFELVEFFIPRAQVSPPTDENLTRLRRLKKNRWRKHRGFCKAHFLHASSTVWLVATLPNEFIKDQSCLPPGWSSWRRHGSPGNLATGRRPVFLAWRRTSLTCKEELQVLDWKPAIGRRTDGVSEVLLLWRRSKLYSLSNGKKPIASYERKKNVC